MLKQVYNHYNQDQQQETGYKQVQQGQYLNNAPRKSFAAQQAANINASSKQDKQISFAAHMKQREENEITEEMAADGLGSLLGAAFSNVTGVDMEGLTDMAEDSVGFHDDLVQDRAKTALQRQQPQPQDPRIWMAQQPQPGFGMAA